MNCVRRVEAAHVNDRKWVIIVLLNNTKITKEQLFCIIHKGRRLSVLNLVRNHTALRSKNISHEDSMDR